MSTDISMAISRPEARCRSYFLCKYENKEHKDPIAVFTGIAAAVKSIANHRYKTQRCAEAAFKSKMSRENGEMEWRGFYWKQQFHDGSQPPPSVTQPSASQDQKETVRCIKRYAKQDDIYPGEVFFGYKDAIKDITCEDRDWLHRALHSRLHRRKVHERLAFAEYFWEEEDVEINGESLHALTEKLKGTATLLNEPACGLPSDVTTENCSSAADQPSDNQFESGNRNARVGNEEVGTSLPHFFVVGNYNVRTTFIDDIKFASIIDVISAVNSDTLQPQKTWSSLKKTYQEFEQEARNAKFGGQGQRETPVANAQLVVKIINALTGPAAVAFRQKSADVLVRYLGGDTSLIQEIHDNNQIQATASDNDPIKFFQIASKTDVVSIGTAHNTDQAGVYFAIPGNKLVCDVCVPEGKTLIAFGQSAQSMKTRLSTQKRQFGGFILLDCVPTYNAAVNEKHLKDRLRAQAKLVTATVVNGKESYKITEVFIDDQEGYAKVYMDTLEDAEKNPHPAADVVRQNEQKIEMKKLEIEHDKVKAIDRLVTSDKVSIETVQHIVTTWFK